MTDRAVYQSVLAAVAAGATTPRRIAGAGRAGRTEPPPPARGAAVGRVPAPGRRRAAPAAPETFSSLILGPHFEHLARQWTARHAPPSTWDAEIGEVGGTVVNDPAGRARHQVDVVGLAVGERRQAKHPRVVVLGEAKSASQPRRVADVDRLDRIRALLVARGVRAEGARLALFGRFGFDAELRRLARRGADVVLVDLATLYGRR